MNRLEKLEKTERVIIALLVAIIVIGLAYFGSEVKKLQKGDADLVCYNAINMSEFRELVSLKSTKVIYFGAEGCDYCKEQDSVLKKVSQDYGIKIHYFDLDQGVTEDDGKYIYSIYPQFQEDGLKTPTLLVIKDGKGIDALVGVSDEDTMISFFLKNNVIETE